MSNRALHELERVEWRVLGALRPVDGTTGIVVRGALDVSAAGARIVRNRSGLYVIHEWTRLASHAAAFAAPPAQPATGGERLEVALRDPSGRYLPRLASIALPRDPQAAGADSLFAAVDVPLYPSAIAATLLAAPIRFRNELTCASASGTFGSFSNCAKVRPL